MKKIPKRISGTLTQSAVDTNASIIRQTGVSLSRFEAVSALYVGFSLTPSQVRLWATPCSLKVDLLFPGSQERIKWYFASFSGAGVGMFYPTFEIYAPASGTPDLYEEEVAISISTENTNQANALDYVMYFDIVQHTELELVQERARYV